MPIYEYACMSCESHFEELVRSDETPACPSCGTDKVKRQLSVFARHGSTPQPKLGAPAVRAGGGCCGGACGGH